MPADLFSTISLSPVFIHVDFSTPQIALLWQYCYWRRYCDARAAVDILLYFSWPACFVMMTTFTDAELVVAPATAISGHTHHCYARHCLTCKPGDVAVMLSVQWYFWCRYMVTRTVPFCRTWRRYIFATTVEVRLWCAPACCRAYLFLLPDALILLHSEYDDTRLISTIHYALFLPIFCRYFGHCLIPVVFDRCSASGDAVLPCATVADSERRYCCRYVIRYTPCFACPVRYRQRYCSSPDPLPT